MKNEFPGPSPVSSAKRAGAVIVLMLLAALLSPPTAVAAVSVAKAELKGTTVRIEGTAAANRSITVDGVAMGTSDGSGRFKIERSGFTAPADCTVDVNDGSATAAVARLSGCTVSTSPSPSPVAISSLTLNQSTVVGGTEVQGTVTLTAAAPAGGSDVAMSSDNTTAATVGTPLRVPAGATSAGFTVTTKPVTNSQSSLIVGTLGGVSKGTPLTVTTEFQASNGSVSLARGGGGSGRVTSQPAGIDCTITPAGGSGTCGNVFFAAGTEVRLDARPAEGSKFVGWEAENSCREAPKVVVLAGVAHICRPVFLVD